MLTDFCVLGLITTPFYLSLSFKLSADWTMCERCFNRWTEKYQQVNVLNFNTRHSLGLTKGENWISYPGVVFPSQLMGANTRHCWRHIKCQSECWLYTFTLQREARCWQVSVGFFCPVLEPIVYCSTSIQPSVWTLRCDITTLLKSWRLFLSFKFKMANEAVTICFHVMEVKNLKFKSAWKKKKKTMFSPVDDHKDR